MSVGILDLWGGFGDDFPKFRSSGSILARVAALLEKN